MDITLRLRDSGDTKLFLQPEADAKQKGGEESNIYILVRSQEDFENP